MIYFLLFFIKLSSHALDQTEKVSPAKILSVYKDNIIKMNRGLEDGIKKYDHMKLIESNEGYVSRGVCLKADSENSWWKIYRLPEANLVSKDLSYSIVGHNDVELTPERIKQFFSTVDLEKLEESDAQKDLPESI